MSKIYDAIIIGAGPAGCSSAYFLAQSGLSVLVLEKSIFPRDKVCGEFISPAAWKVLDQLGVREALKEQGCQTVKKAALYSHSGQVLTLDFEPDYGIGLSRKSLDDLLLKNAVSQGAEVLHEMLVSDFHREENKLWTVKAVSKKLKTPQIFQSRRMVLADGRKLASSQSSKKGMFGFKAHYRGSHDLDETLELFFLDVGYGGLVQIEDGIVNACFLLDIKKVPVDWIPDRPDEFMDWIFSRHKILRDRMKGAMRMGPLLTTGPLSFGFKKGPEQDDLFRVGDEMGVIDPFFGEGITLALESGFLLGQSCSDRSFKSMAKKSFYKRFCLARTLRLFSPSPLLMDLLIRVFSKTRIGTQFLFRLAHGL